MAGLEFKPTRMELQNLKKRRKVASRGHKLMKDKRDELVRRFIVYIKRNKELRERVEERLGDAFAAFVLAKATMSPENIEEAFAYPAARACIISETKSELSVTVPKLGVTIEHASAKLPYSFSDTSAELDDAVTAFSELLPLLIELAEVEKTCNMLADEIEKSRRRVNALEYVMLPQLDEAIRAIRMKLDENERGNLTRLMKTKDMLAKRE